MRTKLAEGGSLTFLRLGSSAQHSREGLDQASLPRGDYGGGVGEGRKVGVF